MSQRVAEVDIHDLQALIESRPMRRFENGRLSITDRKRHGLDFSRQAHRNAHALGPPGRIQETVWEYSDYGVCSVASELL